MPASENASLNHDTTPRPPWIVQPGVAPWWGGWRQGNAQPWFQDVFLPFWNELSDQERQEYLARWPAPDAEWLAYLEEAPLRRRTPPDFSQAVPPPWVRYPGHGPRWIGWYVGGPRRWLRDQFLCFWLPLDKSEQEEYLRRWSPPTARWRAQLFRWNEIA